jgi:integration host factor subunit alpha
VKLRAQVFEDKTMARTVTRADLAEAVYQEVGLSRHESAQLVEAVLSVVSDSLVEGDTVKISSFGTFAVRQKGERVGRNPKTGEEVPILPRKVLVFRASNVLKDRIGKSLADVADLDLETEDDEAEA